MAIIAVCLSSIGCLLLSLSLRRNFRQMVGDDAAYRRRLWPMRIAGYGCVLLALWPCILEAGPWIGITLWIAIFALSAFLQIMLQTYRPGLLR
jgi:Protein of unknown function (DUF3325)